MGYTVRNNLVDSAENVYKTCSFLVSLFSQFTQLPKLLELALFPYRCPPPCPLHLHTRFTLISDFSQV